MLSKEAVVHVLSGINDPELNKPLTELDMVKDVTVDNGDVRIDIRLTVPGCPHREKITHDITQAVSRLADTRSVRVEFDVMTDQQRQVLKGKLGMASPSRQDAATIINFAKRFIAIASGKGGVGKSTCTANIAGALAGMGRRVGVLDADVYGFSIPHMMGLQGEPTTIDDKMVPLRKRDNLQVVSMGFFVDKDEPVIWRGPLLHKAITQFLTDVVWDDLDYLLLDLPPGTGDVTLTIAQAVPSAELIVVTTPQATATHVAGRVARVAQRTKLRVLGVIENMAYYEIDGKKEFIFGREGGKLLAQQLGVNLIGEIPLDPSIRESADAGKIVALEGTDEQRAIFEGIAQRIDMMTSR